MLPTELPPITNKPLYAYRVLMKWLSYCIFGLCTVILGFLIFPPMRLVLHPKERFQKYGRRFVSAYMVCFVFIMQHILRVIDLEAGPKEAYRNLSSKIIVANHPSLLDVVMILSLIPNADCIVNANLARGIVAGVVRQLYIFNSLDYNDILRSCAESLNKGNCLIIFPEGTRTPRYEKIIVKKGAARIALSCGCGIIPLHIGGTDKYGIGKHDSWTGFNPQERYMYRISMKEEIHPEKYQGLPLPAATQLLTRDIAASIFSAE